MKFSELRKRIGASFRLIPQSSMLEYDGSCLRSRSDKWRLDAMLEKPPRILLVNTRTNTNVEIERDSVIGFQSPDYLLLNCYITSSHHGVEITPIDVVRNMSVVLPTLESIVKTINAVPPLQRDAVRNNLIGTRVICSGRFMNAYEIEPNRANVSLVTSEGELDVFFQVTISDYPRLQLAQQNMPVIVKGRFAGGWYDLVECHMEL